MRTLTAALRRAASGPGQFRPDTSQGERPGRRVKRFTPDAGATWLLTDIVTTENGSESPSSMDRRPLVISDPEDPDRAFRLCDLGFVRLQELAALRGRLRPPIERDFGFADKPISGYAREARLSGRIVAWPAPSAGSLCGWRGLPSWLCRLRFIVQSGSWASVEAGRLRLRTRHARAYARLRLGRSKRGAVAGRLGTGAAGGRAPLVHGDAHRTGVGAMGERADVLRATHRASRIRAGMRARRVSECRPGGARRRQGAWRRVERSRLSRGGRPRRQGTLAGSASRCRSGRVAAGCIVEPRARGASRAVNATIVETAQQGVCRREYHVASLRACTDADPEGAVDMHVRRLEALAEPAWSSDSKSASGASPRMILRKQAGTMNEPGHPARSW